LVDLVQVREDARGLRRVHPAEGEAYVDDDVVAHDRFRHVREAYLLDNAAELHLREPQIPLPDAQHATRNR
jgi:hypothetical protein